MENKTNRQSLHVMQAKVQIKVSGFYSAKTRLWRFEKER